MMATSPRLTFIGHAGFLLSYGGTSILCDPWISESGAFLQSWHQFPPNNWISNRELFEVDYIYISHLHQDHFDREFLSAFPNKDVRILIAHGVTPTLAQEIRSLGLTNVIVLDDWENFALAPDFTINIVRDQALYKGDSLLLAKVGDVVILNKNDCHVGTDLFERFRDIGVDLLLAQFSPATWYPHMYDYDPERQRELSDMVKRDLLEGFVRVANGIGARNVVPCAGPPCFLDESMFHLNFKENGIFADQSDVIVELQDRVHGEVHALVPGDVMTLSCAEGPRIRRVRPFDFSEKKRTLAAYADARRASIQSFLASLPAPEPSFLAAFAEHLDTLFHSSAMLSAQADALVKFTLLGPGGGSISVDTRNGRTAVCNGDLGAPNYEFSFPAAIAPLIVAGKETWEDLFLSMRFSVHCDPDVYNWPLFAILRYGGEAALIAEVERTLLKGRAETIVVDDDGMAYRVQRYCPHSGEDLSYARIDDGRLVCPRHGWTFDLRQSGRCVRGGNLSLMVQQEPR